MKTGFEPPGVASPYTVNNLGEVLYRTVLALRPRVVIEFGVLNGYSTIAMAQALRDLGAGHLWSYDLWDDFPYNHGNRDQVQHALDAAGLDRFVSLGQMDFWEWRRQPSAFDLLCLDIANDGRVVRAAAELLNHDGARASTVVFEGGSAERDLAWWMVKFTREPIAPLRDELGFRALDERFPPWSIMPASRPAPDHPS